MLTQPETCYAYLVYDWWKKNFPEGEFVYVNAGEYRNIFLPLDVDSGHWPLCRSIRYVRSGQPVFLFFRIFSESALHKFPRNGFEHSVRFQNRNTKAESDAKFHNDKVRPVLQQIGLCPCHSKLGSGSSDPRISERRKEVWVCSLKRASLTEETGAG